MSFDAMYSEINKHHSSGGYKMKNRIINTAATALLALVIVSGAAVRLEAGEKISVNQENLLRNFKYSLEWKEYPGIVEGTIYNVVVCKNRYPELVYAYLADVLKRLAEENANPAIGYKAHLAYMYLNNSSAIELTPGITSPNDVFKEISEKLEQKFLASHSIR